LKNANARPVIPPASIPACAGAASGFFSRMKRRVAKNVPARNAL
jgi:hypothetical protein